MFRSRRRAIAIALFMVLPLVLAACSATGGKKAAEAAAGGGTAVAAGHANTKHYTVAMITHASPGDTFWDIIRAGATAADLSLAAVDVTRSWMFRLLSGGWRPPPDHPSEFACVHSAAPLAPSVACATPSACWPRA
jgi:hypothetical protein